eukprot:TRINITY_DN11735_c1_g5_i3.p1 TRINITY_DN11735_c1_g5~~TRINITY_DN11735_c1_g5_i3.p1  ORF type:complete len:591 (+),score=133.24 TRINITY_DN11735_c1_g5_i3:152-1924(+)
MEPNDEGTPTSNDAETKPLSRRTSRLKTPIRKSQLFDGLSKRRASRDMLVGDDGEPQTGTPNKLSREQSARNSATMDNVNLTSDPNSDDDDDDEKLGHLQLKLDGLESKLEEYEKALKTAKDKVQKLEDDNVTDTGNHFIPFNRNAEQSELKTQRKRMTRKQKHIEATEAEIKKVKRKIRRKLGLPEDEDGEGQGGRFKGVSNVLQQGGNVLRNITRLSKNPTAEDIPPGQDDDADPTAPSPERGRNSSSAGEASAQEQRRSPSPPPRDLPSQIEEDVAKDTSGEARLQRKRSSTMTETGNASPYTRKRGSTRSMGSSESRTAASNRDTPRSLRSQVKHVKALLTPRRRKGDKHSKDDGGSDASGCSPVEEEMEPPNMDSLSADSAPRSLHTSPLPPNGDISEALLRLLVPDSNAAPEDLIPLAGMQQKLSDLESDLTTRDETNKALKAEIARLQSVIQQHQDFMKRVQAKIEQDKAQLEHGVGELERKLTDKLKANESKMTETRQQLLHMRQSCDSLVMQARQWSVQMSETVSKLQAQEQALSSAQAESNWSRLYKFVDPTQSSTSQNILIPGMVLLVVVVYLSKLLLQ